MTNLLDCTFRDGGYYNDWSFSDEVVEAYLVLFDYVKNVEIGYIGKQNRFGKVSLVDYLFFNNINPSVDLYLMFDFCNFNANKDVIKEFFNVNCNFRVAVNFDKVLSSKSVLDYIKLNNKVSLNLAKFNLLPIDDFKAVIHELNTWDCIDTICLADSFGCCNVNILFDYFCCCRENTSKKIGFHAHNNNELAYQNSVYALDFGLDSVDCTFGGMGKGAGNCTTESLLRYLDCYDASLDNLGRQFDSLKKVYGWGTNKFYKLAADNFVNSAYVFRMINDNKTEMQMNKSIVDLRMRHVFNEEIYKKVCS